MRCFVACEIAQEQDAQGSGLPGAIPDLLIGDLRLESISAWRCHNGWLGFCQHRLYDSPCFLAIENKPIYGVQVLCFNALSQPFKAVLRMCAAAQHMHNGNNGICNFFLEFFIEQKQRWMI